MKRRLFYLAFVASGYGPAKYQWYQALVDMDGVDEFMAKVQTEHMANRLVGAYRLFIPFAATFRIGDIQHLDYQI